MKRASCSLSSLFCGALILACGGKNPGDDTQSAMSTTNGIPSGSVTSVPGSATDATVGDNTPTAVTSTTTEPDTNGSTGAMCNSLPCDNEDLPDGPCDVFGQDCPEGQKCAAYNPDGGTAWNDSKCVQVTGTDKPGEMCTSKRAGSGIDSCIKGAMCWGFDMNGDGICVAQCAGSAEAPVCEDPTYCHVAGDGALNLCMKDDCDPLLQDCLFLTDGCYPSIDGFACKLDGSGAKGQANDPCEYVNFCDAGLMCTDAASVGMGCAPGSQSCCTPFCKFPEGICPNPDQQCVQYFDPVQLPPNDPLLDIGFCGLPS